MTRSLARDLRGRPGDDDLFAQWSALVTPDDLALERLRKLVMAHTRVDAGAAWRVLERLAEESTPITAAQTSHLYRLRGHAARTVGNSAVASSLYRQAWNGFESLGDTASLGATAVGWVDALGALSEAEEAASVARRARRLLPRADGLTRARLSANLGNVWQRAGQPTAAARCYADALRVFEAQGRDWESALCRFNLGQLALDQGRNKTARRYFEVASLAYKERGFLTMEAEAQYGVTAAELLLGNWAQGMERLQELHRILSDLGTHACAGSVQSDLARLMMTLGAPQLAESFARDAVANFRSLQSTNDLANIAYLHGRILADLGHVHDSRIQLSRAATHWKKTGNRHAAYRAQIETAMALVRRGAAANALELTRPALRFLDANDPRGAAPRARWVAALAHLQLGRAALASRLAKRAHADARRYPARVDRPWMALTLSEAASQAGDTRAALRWVRAALREHDARAPEVAGPELVSGMRAGRADLYRRAVDLVLDSGSPRAKEIAFGIVLKGRSAALLDDLLHRNSAGLDRELRTRISQLRETILDQSGPGDVRSRELRQQLSHLEQKVDRRRTVGLARRLSDEHPMKYWKQRFGGKELVIFDSTASECRAHVLRPDGRVDVVDLALAPSALANDWVSLRMIFEAAASTPVGARPEFLERTAQRSNDILHALRASLIDPIGFESDHAYFIPSGRLHGVPLEAIAELDVDASVRLRRITHPALLASSRRSLRRRTGMLLHGPTPGAKAEERIVRAELERAGVAVTTARSADELMSARARTGVLHVSAHAVFHRQQWLLSGFQLEDGWLGFEHLRPRLLRGALVFLGSCESGLGREGPGAELGGWVATGLNAGASEMILSLWKVDDASTQAYSRHFYREWGLGEPATVAARRARAQARALNPHPFSWAPFVAVE